jgi:hypothetical protein
MSVQKRKGDRTLSAVVFKLPKQLTFTYQPAPYPVLDQFPDLVIIKTLLPAILRQQAKGFPIWVSAIMVLAAGVVAMPGIASLIDCCDLLEVLT